MNHAIPHAILSAGLGLLLAAAGAAQEHPAVERGFAPDKVFYSGNSDIDAVDALSGKLNLTIPIGREYRVGGNLSYSITLSYSSSTYSFEEIATGGSNSAAVRSMPARHSNAGYSWLVSVGGALLSPTDPGNETGRYKYRDPSGGEHSMYNKLHGPDTPEAGISYSKDSTYLRLSELAGGKHQLEFPNGEIHTFLADGRIESIRDRFQNEITISYPDPLTWKLEDGSRVHFIRFTTMTSDGAPVNFVEKIELDAFGGATETYEFTYETQSVGRSCSDTFHQEGATFDVPQLTRLTLPDSSSYSMTYNSAECDDGMLQNLTLPTGGRIQYTYVPWELPTSSCNSTNLFAKTTPGVFRRALFVGNTEIGAWTYSQQLQGPPPVPSGLVQSPDRRIPQNFQSQRLLHQTGIKYETTLLYGPRSILLALPQKISL